MNTRSLFLIFVVMALMCGSASAAIPTDYLYYFDFEEGTGTTASNTNTSNNDMALTGSESQLWIYPGAVYFNGSSSSRGLISHESANIIGGTSSFTMAVTWNGTGNIQSIAASKWGNYVLRIINNKPQFEVWDDTTAAVTTYAHPSTVDTNVNHTIVAIGDGSTIKLYVDNSLVDEDSYPTNGIESTDTSDVTIGQASTNYKPGIFYDWWLYDYAVPDPTVFSEDESTTDYSEITYSVTYDRIRVNGISVNMEMLDDDPDSSDYIYDAGDGIWYVNRTLWITNEGILNLTGVTELRMDSITDYLIYMTYNETIDAYGGSSITVPDNITFKGWNSTTDTYEAKTPGVSKTSIFSGMGSVTNLTMMGLGETLVANVEDNSQFDNFVCIGNVSTASVEFAGCNNTLGTPKTYGNNVTFNNPLLYGTGLKITAFDEVEVYNPDYVYEGHSNTTSAITIESCTNFSVHGSRMDETSGCIKVYGGADGAIYDNIANGIWYEEGDPSGGHGIYTYYSGRTGLGPKRLNIYDNIMTNFGYGGLEIKGQDYIYNSDKTAYITLSNNTIDGAEHNGVDIYAANVTAYNTTSRNSTASDGQSFHIQGGYNAFYEGMYSYDKGVFLSGGRDSIWKDIYFYRATANSDPADLIMKAADLWNCSIINIQHESSAMDINTVFYFTEIPEYNITHNDYDNTDVRIIDTDFTPWNAQSYDMIFYNDHDVHLINVKGTYSHTYSAGNPRYVTNYYYPNLRVINTTGHPVSGVSITLNTSAKNGWGYNQTTFYTDENGILYDNGNRSNWLAVRDFVDYDGIEQISSLITASKDGETDTVVVMPDSTWYSTNTSTGELNGTLVTLTLDVPGEGESIPLEIVSFSPTDTTPSSTNGTEQTFTVNFSKTVDSAGWYINGTLVEWDNSTTITSYSNSTALVGTYNVTVIGTVGGESVQQTWIWTVEEESAVSFVAVVFAGLSFVGLYFANRFRRR